VINDDLISQVFTKAFYQWYEFRLRNINEAQNIIKLIELTKFESKTYKDNRYKQIEALEYFYKKDSILWLKWIEMEFKKDRYFSVNRYLKKTEIHNNTLLSLAKNYIKIRDLGICKICGTSENIQVDHIIPKAKLGVSHPWNLQCLCERCNKDKSSIIMKEFIHMIENAKLKSLKFYNNNNVANIYTKLSKYYKTRISDIKQVQKFFNDLIKKKPKLFPEYIDIIDFIDKQESEEDNDKKN